ncbi:hypothetical protein T07_6973 [Trichinella nelsoni]|uniref:DUF5641 domain-containing protein n=1 Tax=Trichinella nelsoni TaxID=6336 RepID=A0A0V0RE26_9BILA|nr:hypothetical protein T07_54 [Trichinella nelsoni]KRX13694.1 hypothetical protein T07_6973 [Trichinella nelsoni]
MKKLARQVQEMERTALRTVGRVGCFCCGCFRISPPFQPQSMHEHDTAWVKWPIRRMIEIQLSEDGVVRSTTLKTRQGAVT